MLSFYCLHCNRSPTDDQPSEQKSRTDVWRSSDFSKTHKKKASMWRKTTKNINHSMLPIDETILSQSGSRMIEEERPVEHRQPTRRFIGLFVCQTKTIYLQQNVASGIWAIAALRRWRLYHTCIERTPQDCLLLRSKYLYAYIQWYIFPPFQLANIFQPENTWCNGCARHGRQTVSDRTSNDHWQECAPSCHLIYRCIMPWSGWQCPCIQN